MFLPSLALLLAARSVPTFLHHRRICRPLKSALHLSDGNENDLVNKLSYRPVNIDDISRCYEIESSSYPEDEAASLENLEYRQQNAGEYFMCATKLHSETNSEHIIGYICSTRCNEFTEESMSVHDASGKILAIHSVVVDASYRRQGVASAMMNEYLKQMLALSNLVADTGAKGFQRILLLAKSNLLSFYVDCGFMVLRPSPIVHGKDVWYELEARRDYMETLLRRQTFITSDEDSNDNDSAAIVTNSRVLGSSRSTSNPDYAADSALVEGRNERRIKLHEELDKLGIDPNEMEHHPEKFGTAAMRTYNSFLLPKSKGALAVAESPTRARVVANNISFLVREFKADQEEWLRNVDRNRKNSVSKTEERAKHPVVIVLDNVRSAHNVGNILRLAEAAQVESVRLCGMTPRPPHPKIMKTAMGAAEYVDLGNADTSTLQTVLDLKAKGYDVYGVETTETAITLWGAPISSNPVAFVFGNELIGVDVEVLEECKNVISLPTYGNKNSLNIATCVGIVAWDYLRRRAT